MRSEKGRKTRQKKTRGKTTELGITHVQTDGEQKHNSSLSVCLFCLSPVHHQSIFLIHFFFSISDFGGLL